VSVVAGVEVIPDDLARTVDTEGFGAVGGRGIVEGGVSAAAVKEAVAAVSPDDLAHIVDAVRQGAVGGQGIIEGGVSAPAVEEAMAV